MSQAQMAKPSPARQASSSRRKATAPQKRRSVVTSVTASLDTGSNSRAAAGQAASGRQSIEARRQVRREYRKLLDDLDENKQELMRPESGALEEKMKKGNEIYSQVTMPREAALDSEFLSATSQLGLEQVNRLHTHFKTYDASTFIQRVRQVLLKKDPLRADQAQDDEEDQEMDWEHLGQQTIRFFKVTPTVDFLYGPLSATPKERKARTRMQKEELGKKVVPEEVKSTEADAEEETSKRVEKMAKALQSVESKRCFEFLANPNSFSQTVENLFHLSFLIKEGRAGLELSKIDDTPILRPMNPPEDKSKAQNKQCVVKFDYKTFLDVIDVFGIKKPFLEHRPPPQRPKKFGEISTSNGTASAAADAAAESISPSRNRSQRPDSPEKRDDSTKKRKRGTNNTHDDDDDDRDETREKEKETEKGKEKERPKDNEKEQGSAENTNDRVIKRKRDQEIRPETEKESSTDSSRKRERQEGAAAKDNEASSTTIATEADKNLGNQMGQVQNHLPAEQHSVNEKQAGVAAGQSNGPLVKNKKVLRLEFDVKKEPGIVVAQDEGSYSEDTGSSSGSDSASSEFSDDDAP